MPFHQNRLQHHTTIDKGRPQMVLFYDFLLSTHPWKGLPGHCNTSNERPNKDFRLC